MRKYKHSKEDSVRTNKCGEKFPHFSKLLKSFDSIICNNKKSVILGLISSVILNFLLEFSQRKNPVAVFKFIFTSPIVFLIGTLIIFASFSFMYFFKKRTFAYSVIAFLWLVVLAVNFFLMVLFQRSTPFNFSDLRIFNTTRDIINNGYVNFKDFILIAVSVIVFLLILAFVFFKSRKAGGSANICSFFAIQICAVTLISVVLYTNIAVSIDKFDNLPNKYKEHGFTFCFLYSLIDNGIDKPVDYSPKLYDDTRKQVDKEFKEKTPETETNIEMVENPELVDAIFDMVISDINSMPDYPYLGVTQNDAYLKTMQLTEKHNKYSESEVFNPDGSVESFSNNFEKPNIIFLQLESFYDMNNIMGYEYSMSPHPIYSMLKEKLPGGKLTVPSIGAGTANTEFEIMTGMDVSFFGIAEYPYLSILQNQTCESICYNAKNYGYASHAIHNHKGTFYDRYKVFPNLGYDTFTSIESMPKIVRNERNWCKDSVLTEAILASLKSTEQQDLIYTISVQPHGKYPSESVYSEILDGHLPRIQVSGNEHNPENPGFTYYVNQLSEVDSFLGNLILELVYNNEPTILVFYGDHLPSFSVQKYWNLKEGNCYQTDYMIWNNCGFDFSDAKDLSTFQLASYIFSKVGIDSGEINKLNRTYLGSEDVDDYHNLRHRYQYAIFYDDELKDPTSKISIPKYQRVETEYGIFKASLSSVYTIGNTTYVTGNEFNEFTYLVLNGEKIDTDLIDSGTVSTKHVFTEGDIISTGQYSNNVSLGQSSNVIIYSDSMIIPDNLHEETLDEILPTEYTPVTRYEEYDYNTPETPYMY